MEKDSKDWYVYIVECSDSSYYCGITTDVERRIRQHNTGKGAKYTRGRGPVKLIAVKSFTSKSKALSVEYGVKKQKKKDKVEYLGKIMS